MAKRGIRYDHAHVIDIDESVLEQLIRETNGSRIDRSQARGQLLVRAPELIVGTAARQMLSTWVALAVGATLLSPAWVQTSLTTGPDALQHFVLTLLGASASVTLLLSAVHFMAKVGPAEARSFENAVKWTVVQHVRDVHGIFPAEHLRDLDLLQIEGFPEWGVAAHPSNAPI